MNIEEIGLRILTARKKLNYTQRQLADIISVSDKTISKWERGIGCPDISLLLPLSEVLKMSVDELIGGINNDEIKNEEEGRSLQNMIGYAKMKTIENKEKIFKIGYSIITGLIFISIGLNLLVDFILNNSFTWSIISVSSLIYSWIIVSALLLFKENKLIKTVITASIAVFVLLYIIALQLFDTTWFITGAFPIALTSSIYVIGVTHLWVKTSINIFNKIAIMMYGSLIVNLVTNYIAKTENYIMVINTVIILMIATIFLIFGTIRYKKVNLG